MKNLFKRREKKEHTKPEIDHQKQLSPMESVHAEQEVLELQTHGEFLETDEDLGYC
ncbi:MAG: hypothetical protein IPM92_02465 [Saprospiraceae bacterium]|nr:hypothetical protein [Saprospiraceae bacterium]